MGVVRHRGHLYAPYVHMPPVHLDAPVCPNALTSICPHAPLYICMFLGVSAYKMGKEGHLYTPYRMLGCYYKDNIQKAL